MQLGFASQSLPSIATPNGQPSFLFILTASIAPLLDLSYGSMMYMTLPYTVTMTAAGLFGVMAAL